jgi:hypothetical protein
LGGSRSLSCLPASVIHANEHAANDVPPTEAVLGPGGSAFLPEQINEPAGSQAQNAADCEKEKESWIKVSPWHYRRRKCQEPKEHQPRYQGAAEHGWVQIGATTSQKEEAKDSDIQAINFSRRNL